jgi:hypothetical protein
MIRVRVKWAAALIIASAARSGSATTIIPLSFSERIERSALVIEGTVVDRHAVKAAGGVSVPAAKLTGPPAVQPAQPDPQAVAPQGAAAAPVAAGTRSGRMIFTEITLAVDRAIVGAPDKLVTFRIAGGTLDGQTATVFGMPTFELGERYLVFLRSGFETTADPIVGVNQGFFRVVHDAQANADTLLNADADIVLGVENDKIVVRHSAPAAGLADPELVAAPAPDGDTPVSAGLSPEVERYWHSTEPATSVDRFAEAVRAAKEGR